MHYRQRVLQLSQETYEADLPELVKKHVGSWVVYHGAHRYGVFETELDAWDSCENESVPFTERFVRQIVIDPPFGNRLVQGSWTQQ